MSDNGYIKVRAVMVPNPKVVDRMATVAEAIDLMRQHSISSLVIDRRHEGDEYGLVVMRDIASKVVGADRAPERTNVYEIMSKPVLTLDAEMDVKYAIRLLDRFGLSRALVTDGGQLTGIVTLRDMVLHYVAPEEGGAGG